MKFLLISTVLMLVSCGQLYSQPYSWENFKKCVESAPSVMLYPVQLEQLGKSYHAIGSYQRRGLKSYEWGTYVTFGSRYQIVMAIDVQLNNEHSEIIKILGEPRFRLLIYDNIIKNKGGGYESSFEADIKFTRKEWAEMVKHSGDIEKMLAVINVIENKAKLQHFDELAEIDLPEPKYRIRLTP